jgi:CRP/FNR family cyclic AMP-dependent transcriptional regulator
MVINVAMLTNGNRGRNRGMDKAAALAVMTEHGWLSRRPMTFREEVVRRSRLQHFDTGASFYNAGDDSHGMYGLVSGLVLIRLPPADTIGSVASPGTWLGDATAFRREARWVSATAGAPSWVLHLEQRDFEEMIRDAENCRHFAINTSEALSVAVTIVSNLIQPDSEVRVAQRLLTFMGLFGETRQRALTVTQADLGVMCGLSRQTMSKVLTGMVEAGIIAVGYRRIDIIDEGALYALATHDERVWR